MQPQESVVIAVTYTQRNGAVRTEQFNHPIIIGRDEECDICIPSDLASKRHLEIYPDGAAWWVRDLGSTNGTYLNNNLLQLSRLPPSATIQIGKQGPLLQVEQKTVRDGGKAAKSSLKRRVNRTMVERRPEPPPGSFPSPQSRMKTRQEQNPLPEKELRIPGKVGRATMVVQRFLNEKLERAGSRTQIIRIALAKYKQEHTKRFAIILAIVGGISAISIAFSVYQHFRFQRLNQLAISMFYDMKSMELSVEKLVDAMGDTNKELTAQIIARREKLKEAQKQYEHLLEQLGAVTKDMPPETRLILRMARMLGECELAMPDGFVSEVKRYIKQWQSTPRLAKAHARIEKYSYANTIVSAMSEQYLPPQLLYVALQESDFRSDAVGPASRWGYAKGFWQFIPATALQYGLKVGPLVDLPVYDPKDERFDFSKSTKAAVKYLRTIYNTEAQASGLLVLASYNWGHNSVIRLIRKMPDNPRERNFWQLLKTNKIPKQTYDYVFYIFAAAVIGEDPALFRFDFVNPLKEASEPPVGQAPEMRDSSISITDFSPGLMP